MVKEHLGRVLWVQGPHAVSIINWQCGMSWRGGQTRQLTRCYLTTQVGGCEVRTGIGDGAFRGQALDWSFRIGLTQDKKKKIGPGFGVQSGAVISFSIYFSLFS